MSSDLHVSADTVLTEVDYVTSDHHFNHRNIIEYCRNEEFAPTRSGLDDMNWALIANWNRHVDPEDTVVFLGDFAWFIEEDPITQRKVDNLWDALNGRKIFVRGDHDHVLPSSVSDVVYSVEIRHNDRAYFVSHFPGDTPDALPGKGMPDEFRDQLPANFADRCHCWRIHGHHHNNWPDIYPLSNPERRTINCSIELTGYRPLSIGEVEQIVAQDDRIRSV